MMSSGRNECLILQGAEREASPIGAPPTTELINCGELLDLVNRWYI